MSTGEKLDEILRRLDYIEQLLTNPAQTLSAERKAELLRKAHLSGDKNRVKAALKQINGR